MNDIRFALRMLSKHPGFTVVAVLTLALGISANTTIFATISGIFFQPLPVKDPERLVLVLQKSAVWKMPHGHSWPDYLDYKERVGVFEGVLAVMLNPAHISVPGQQAERAWIEATSGNYFSMLGIDAAHGRLFLPNEAKHAVNQRKREIGIRIALGAQKVDILGLVLRSGLRLTVIGVGIGLLASLGLAALISKVLYGLAPASIPVLVAVPLLVIGVSLLACYLPARRAAIIDPMEALRYE